MHARISRKATTNVTPLISLCPIAKCGIEIFRPFPLAFKGKKFILMFVNYFSRWVKAKPLAAITIEKVISFIWKCIISMFGIPWVLITNNGIQFNIKFNNLCTKLQTD